MASETGRGGASELMVRFLRDENANTAVEYTVLVATLTLLILVGYRQVGQSLPVLFNKVGDTFANALK